MTEGTAVYNNETEQLKHEVLTKLDDRLLAIRKQMDTLQPLMSNLMEEKQLIEKLIVNLKAVDK